MIKELNHYNINQRFIRRHKLKNQNLLRPRGFLFFKKKFFYHLNMYHMLNFISIACYNKCMLLSKTNKFLLIIFNNKDFRLSYDII
jgi:hypothetical protein